MKTVTVHVDLRAGESTSYQLNISNATHGDPLDAKMARQARDMIAPRANVTVTDGATTWRVTKSGAKRQ